jgi:hypothetical protein
VTVTSVVIVARSRRSARGAGTRFERLLADYLALHVDDRIDRRVKTGAKDRGDIANLRSSHGARIVVEAKDCATVSLGTWQREAETERANDDALLSLVAHKRHGHARAGDQWITCTVDDLVAMLTGSRPPS